MRYFTQESLKAAMAKVTVGETDPAYAALAAPVVLTFPFTETAAGPAAPAVGVFWQLRNGSKQHTVGFCRRLDLDSESWFPVCGAPYMLGKWPAAKMESSMQEAVAGLPSTGRMTAAEFIKQAEGGVDFAQNDSKCSFWREYQQPGGRVLGCKHVATVAFSLAQAGTVDDVLEPVAGGGPGAASAASIIDPLDAFRQVCPADPGRRRKFPVLVFGDFGEGKTTDARAFADTDGFDVVIECHGHAGMESIDFLGGTLPLPGKEGLSWVDGPVTEAFRHAASGRKVMLILDEIYRVPRRERSVFMSALSPATRRDGTIVYRLKTGRPVASPFPDMPPTIELLEAPEAKITLVGTTNAGPAFDVEDDDPAEASRWHKVYCKMGDDRKRTILKNLCTDLGFSTRVAGCLVKFANSVRKLKEDGQAKQAPSLRELVRAVHVARDERDIPAVLKGMAASWVGLNTDGAPNSAQVAGIEHAATHAFK